MRRTSLFLGIGCLAAAPLSPARAQERVLYPAPQFRVAGNPREIELGDVDGDGDLDAVTANFLQSTVTVAPGAGNGSFGESAAVSSACCSPASLSLGDLDGDGFLDAAVGSPQGPGNTAVHLGTGAGTLGPARIVSTEGAEAVALADVDLDGALDLVMGASASTLVLLGRGDGTFAAPTGLASSGGMLALELADLGGDGFPEVVGVRRNGNTLVVFKGSAGGSFGASQEFVVGPPLLTPLHLALGDLDRDGAPDAVVGSSGLGVSVALGDRSGGFRPPQAFATGGEARRVELGDVDGDGRLDVAFPLGDTHAIGVLTGKGNGTLRPVKRWVVGTRPQALALGDVNGDGRLDAVAATSNPFVSVLLGTPAGFGVPRDLASAPAPIAVALGDVDGDAFSDALLAHEGASAVQFLANDRNGGFTEVGAPDVGGEVRALALGDVNGDGRADALVASGVAGRLSVFFRSERGFVGPATWSVGTRPASLALGDLDQDGVPEAITANPGSGDISVVRLAARHVLGSVAPSFPAGVGAKDVVLADFDRDGDLDAAVANDVANRGVSILRGDGAGRFGPRTDHLAFLILGTTAVGAGDLDDDGWPDVAVAGSSNPGLVSLLTFDGIGAFVPSLAGEAGFSPSDLVVRDLDADGRDELATCDTVFGTVGVLVQLSAGGFRASSYASGGEGGFDSEPRALAAGFLDADTLPDLVVANRGSDVLSVLLHRAKKKTR